MGKFERVYVSLEAIYSNNSDHQEEFSFEELRAKARGWLVHDWAAESQQQPSHGEQHNPKAKQDTIGVTRRELTSRDTTPNSGGCGARNSSVDQLETTIAIDISKEGKVGPPKKTKIKEIKGATQTGMRA